MTLRAKARLCAQYVAAAFFIGLALFIVGYIITGNFSGQSYSSGTYCSGCAPKWSK